MDIKSDFNFLYLQHEEVKATGFDMKSFVDIEEMHFRLYDEGKIILPDKVVLDLGERERGRINALLAYVGGEADVCGIKWVASFPNNPRNHQIPRANAFIILNDSNTGTPISVMDGTYISAMRTGAVTGVGAKYLARKDSESVAMIGCGVQAKTQLMALQTVYPDLSEVRCYDIKEATADAYAAEMQRRTGLKIKSVRTVEEAAVDADIIVTVTVADEPILKDAYVKKGSLVVHVGSYQEEEEDVVYHSDKIVVDEWASVFHRRTPILAKMCLEGKLDEKDIYANLGEIVNGKKKGRNDSDERIFLLPIGMGSEDVIAAYEIFQLAKEKDIGTELKLCDHFMI